MNPMETEWISCMGIVYAGRETSRTCIRGMSGNSNISINN